MLCLRVSGSGGRDQVRGSHLERTITRPAVAVSGQPIDPQDWKPRAQWCGRIADCGGGSGARRDRPCGAAPARPDHQGGVRWRAPGPPYSGSADRGAPLHRFSAAFFCVNDACRHNCRCGKADHAIVSAAAPFLTSRRRKIPPPRRQWC